MEDLLELNEVASAIKTEIILPRLNKTIKACTPLVLMGTSMNVMMEPLHQTDKALPQGLHVCPSYGTYNCGSQRMTVQLYITKNHAIIIKKGTVVLEWWPPMRFLRWWWQMVQLEHFELEDGSRKVMLNSPLRREEKSCLKSWSFLVSTPGQKRTKREPSTYWLITMTSSHWKMEKWDALRPQSTRSK